MPGTLLSVDTCTCITSTGACPPGGVRPHHGIEEEQDHEESQERQALSDSRFLISLWTGSPFSFLFLLPSAKAGGEPLMEDLAHELPVGATPNPLHNLPHSPLL